MDTPDSTIGAKEIDRRDREKQKFGIGYHFVIRRDGTIDRGRNVDEIGLHVRNYNDCSVGVCLIGGKDRSGSPAPSFSHEQMAALRELLEDLLEDYPDAKACGHADLEDAKAECPGFQVSTWFETGEVKPWRDRQEGDMTHE
jgi:N-acetyl-anhydromuramyl-L-alanine amidase AmpD